ncbi:MAG: hypothetical protein J0M12_10310 [Deltaproteobacteria bacterium]|nr:hypothetical protein [Deltaproteobacteria bacterium]
MTTPSRPPSKSGELLFAACLLALLVWILRLPTANLGLVYYDDGETLYHTLSFISGRVPYVQDSSHHFLGYVLPFVIAAKVGGFSLDLIREVGFVLQLATALGVFCSMRLLARFSTSLLAAAICLSVRQPWVWGFYIQYEINFLSAWILFFSLRYCLFPERWSVLAAALLAGLAFTFDQRAGFLILLPLISLYLRRGSDANLLRTGIAALLSFAIPACAALAYLASLGALPDFWKQTFDFPLRYRSASAGLSEVLFGWIYIYAKLLRDASVACVTALLGFLAMALHRKLWCPDNDGKQRAYRLMLWSAIPFAAMPLFGQRDLPYYVVTWYPLIGMFSALSPRLFLSLPPPLLRFVKAAPLFAVLLPILLVARECVVGEFSNYPGDGRAETVAYLRKHMQAQDTLYVWGYRLDVYADLKKLSPYPFANRIMIHPDQSIMASREQRASHVYPEYEKRFLALLKENPPTYLVLFDRNALASQPSRANDAVQELLRNGYDEVHSIQGIDFLGVPTQFTVYRQRA